MVAVVEAVEAEVVVVVVDAVVVVVDEFDIEIRNLMMLLVVFWLGRL